MEKIKIYLLVLFLPLTFGLKAQTDTLFSDFIALFPGKKISPEYQIKFLKIEGPFPSHRLQYEQRTAKKIIEQTANYILLSVDYHCGAGGICEGVDLYSFTTSGDLISSVVYSEDFGDCEFRDSVDPIYFENQTLITKIRKWKGNCLEETTENESIQMNEYTILPFGEIQLTREQKINLGRKYPQTSTEFLKVVQIKGIGNQELAIMRNELFASYGHKFKSEKWSFYFEQTDWYEPKIEDVSEQELSLVERKNLELIKQLEYLK